MSRSKKVWLLLGGIALAHNFTAEDGDTLSECMDGWLTPDRRVRWIAEAGLLALYCHLSNRIKPSYDPIHLAFVVARKRRRVVLVVEQT
ncbi:hypothetical protein [Mycobacterium gordonae]|uniref:Uncharacterized protein n=1 Tax=Mycobacterium gordonae TaxID=1778 RepID=A0A1X1XCN2_MYCGO|nr:hypothetical protein [Mycobacterium gordonae]MCV7009366.1 hypothetical protein [Mycobacterium gordonae]ODR15942.1 hypothetical protein BHQ23_31715 [Mycobacterium gordonae]ORV96675.1 hypothetical protein AWC08_12145 [Mycobacterium gordonae]